MAHPRNKLVGQRFNQLLVVKENGLNRYGKVWWLCICDCGESISTTASQLKSGRTRSCGCYRKQIGKSTSTTHGYAKFRNTKSEYTTWQNMKDRCNNPNNIKYHLYGGAGISVCERWLESFENFISDMGDKPSKLHSLDRVRGTGNYDPSNCRWATKREQCRNLCTNKWFEYSGIKMIQRDWEMLMNLGSGKISALIKRGLTFDQIIEKYNDRLPPTI